MIKFNILPEEYSMKANRTFSPKTLISNSLNPERQPFT